MSIHNRKPLGLFYSLYEEGNLASQILAFITLTPNLVAIGIFAAFVTTRRIWWIWTFGGIVITDILCLALKYIIDQPRPQGSYKIGSGMPSEHAAVAVFFSVYLILRLFLFVRCGSILKVLAMSSLISWAALVIISRHHIGVHSWEQLIAGAGIGFLMASIWLAAELPFRRKLRALQRLMDSLWKWLDIHCDDGLNHQD